MPPGVLVSMSLARSRSVSVPERAHCLPPSGALMAYAAYLAAAAFAVWVGMAIHIGLA